MASLLLRIQKRKQKFLWAIYIPLFLWSSLCERNVITALLENSMPTYVSLDHDNIRTRCMVSLLKELNWSFRYADLSFYRNRQSVLHFSKQIHFQSYRVLGHWAFRNWYRRGTISYLKRIHAKYHITHWCLPSGHIDTPI